jgi:hypothetical protein
MSEKQSGAATALGITRRQDYREFAETVRPHFNDALAAGQVSTIGIARYLNRQGVRSHTGRVWTKWSVNLLRKVLEGAD